MSTIEIAFCTKMNPLLNILLLSPLISPLMTYIGWTDIHTDAGTRPAVAPISIATTAYMSIAAGERDTSIGMSLLTRVLIGSSRRMAVDTAMIPHVMLMLADSYIYP